MQSSQECKGVSRNNFRNIVTICIRVIANLQCLTANRCLYRQLCFPAHHPVLVSVMTVE